MARVIITTDHNKRYYKKPSALLMTPYIYNAGDRRYYLGDTTYDIYSIIGDTISIVQEDNNVVNLENEFTPIPVLSNATMGKWSFSADCLDTQHAVLKAIYDVRQGYAADNDVVDGLLAFHDDLTGIYCCIQIEFADDAMSTIVLPKVSINSTFNMQNLKSSFLQNKISGTVLATRICVAGENDKALMFKSGVEETYAPSVPLVFIPKGSDFGVLRYVEQSNGQDTNYYFMNMYSDNAIMELDGTTGDLQVSE